MMNKNVFVSSHMSTCFENILEVGNFDIIEFMH